MRNPLNKTLTVTRWHKNTIEVRRFKRCQQSSQYELRLFDSKKIKNNGLTDLVINLKIRKQRIFLTLKSCDLQTSAATES